MYSDLSITGYKSYYNDVQYISLILKNEGDLNDDFKLNIYCNGNLYDSISYNLLIGQEISLQYTSNEFNNGDIIKIEIISDNDKIFSDNIYKCEIKKKVALNVQENNYYEMLVLAKNWLM